MNVLILIITLTGSGYFGAKRLLRHLQFLQQDDYDPSRYLKWVLQTKSFDRKGSLIATLAYIGTFFDPLWSALIAGIALMVVAQQEKDPRKAGKLSLKITKRAKRIYLASLGIYLCLVIFSIAILSISLFWLSQILLYQTIPVILAAACGLLWFDEKKRQALYIKEAKQILKQINPFIIGITGSYGKTSTKDALAQILQITLGATFWPAKGTNTEMGITKEIRTGLRNGHRYGVIEMGAYQTGSIKKLCRLTPPHAAILTCIGTAHLERFKSIDTIKRAKSELAQAVPQNGILVCNGDNPGTRNIAKENMKQTTLLYGLNKEAGHLDCWMVPKEMTIKGTSFELTWQGRKFQGHTSLFGKPALSNLAGAFTMACALGAQPEFVVAAIKNIEPVDNRLQVCQENGMLFLRDAYNSNPEGFASALEVMKALPGNKRVLMTPGIIELGHEQYAENEKIGRLSASVCDIAIIVNQENKLALSNGLLSGGMPSKKIFFCNTRKEAFEKLNHLVEKNDIVLIENDLPDLYETYAKF